MRDEDKQRGNHTQEEMIENLMEEGMIEEMENKQRDHQGRMIVLKGHNIRHKETLLRMYNQNQQDSHHLISSGNFKRQ